MKIAVACGGTGGHIFPGLAAAVELKERGHDVSLWLAGRDVESSSIAGWDGDVTSVPAAGFPSKISLSCIPVAFKLMSAVLNCRSKMKKSRPDVLLAMGSYASVGPVLAARSLGTDVVLHEANVIPGRAISFLSRFAKKVAISFPDTRSFLKRSELAETGFPVRKELMIRHADREPDTFTILVMGGSQGAHRLNEISMEAMKLLKESGAKFHIIHLTGKADEEQVKRAYEESGISAEVLAFLSDMNRAFNAADIAVCRSGAATCSELALCGVPAIFVPLPSSMHGHQMANAKSFERTGCAAVVEQKDFTPEVMSNMLRKHLEDGSELAKMAQAMKHRAEPDAVVKLADLVENIKA